MADARDTYHHGDLRQALLDAAAEEIAEHGPGAISLRSIARRAGVSHAAPAHHFGDRAGLLSAVATEGFRRMNAAMETAAASADGGPEAKLNAIGRAYVNFARAHPGEFAVMFRPELLDPDDVALTEEATAAHGRLTDAIASEPTLQDSGETPDVTAARSWALVHGLATLIINGSLPDDDALVDAVISEPLDS
ncbi:MAG: TetR/AcrR family transcriptional regulator [Acidimicrobiales bacterium]